YRTIEIGGDGLCSAESLDPKSVDLLVLPDGSALPADSMKTIENFLRGGGDLIAFRTPLWQRPLICIQGDWLTHEEYALSQAAKVPDPENLLLDFNPSRPVKMFQSSSNKEQQTLCEFAKDEPLKGSHALHVSTPNLTGWDSVVFPDLGKPFPGSHTLTVFSAKGGLKTTQLAVEWTETNGSRWIATIPLTTEWRRYILKPSDFKLWYDFVSTEPYGKVFDPTKAKQISFSLAFTHTTAIGEGAHEYSIAHLGTAAPTGEYQVLAEMTRPPALETLSPTYKFYEMTDVGSVESRSDQSVVSRRSYAVPKSLRSSYARPKGSGFDKDRDWRWIPLLEACSSEGDWRGFPATLLIHAEGVYKGGIWASFSVEERDWYRSSEVLDSVAEIARFMKQGTYLVDGGSNFYTYFEKQTMTLGVRAVDFESAENLFARVRVFENSMRGSKVLERVWPLSLQSGEIGEVSDVYTPKRWPKKGFRVVAELLHGKQSVDMVSHEAHVWRPKKRKEYITVHNGEFVLKGERWRAHGVNYMPSSGLGTEDGNYFEHYLQKRSYDSEVYSRDLDHVKDMGLNSVSIFIYGDMYTGEADKDQNLLDILRLLEERDLRVNLSLRPGDPVNYYDKHPIDKMLKDFVQYYRLAENDTLFAYDLAWEPSFGHHLERKKWDRDWENWIVERYGSVEAAEQDWGFKVPRDDDGLVTNPLPEHVDSDGDYRVMTAAYRRFLDTLLYKKYRY
ncbi:MAG TPA: hypothetical protein PKH07_11420, partial [bacterium]|nr:hypothetical protein [bacterium]